MNWLFTLLLQLSTTTGPVDMALGRAEAPNTLRAAFTIELVSQSASRAFSYDASPVSYT